MLFENFAMAELLGMKYKNTTCVYLKKKIEFKNT